MKTCCLLSLLFLIDAASGLSRPHSRRAAIAQSIATAAASLAVASAPPALASYLDPNQSKVTQRVFMDVELSSGESGRLVIGLFGDNMPRVTTSFTKLCENNAYEGTRFYRVLSGMTIQGGAIGDLSGKKSDQPTPYEPDNFNILHSKEGLVSMVRGLSGSVDSRFFINTVADGGWADDRYAAFGIVEEGMDLVHKIEHVQVKPPQNSPKDPVKIIRSGIL
jgi:cyclophilin family peptidyl-prolyl cis-trans isomerase